ncbi:hypothetical protein [Pseudomonas juntendi]|uniref:hypothetical protein n=1 Tax=Pseudomonas juntendi TaxID=2666183 RepID=UPI0015FAF82A|nr:hypothetical protein [Pseudomonas juntendi]MBA6134838.1 hypothetical protein [Pseudomonas juntendi]
MSIDKQVIKVLADHVKTDRRFCADEYHHALAEGVLAMLAEISRIEIDAAYVAAGSRTRAEVIDQLKAENEALRKALGEISGQVDGNIRCVIRDVVNCRGDVQDIYGYCDAIDGIIDAAMAKETSHG